MRAEAPPTRLVRPVAANARAGEPELAVTLTTEQLRELARLVVAELERRPPLTARLGDGSAAGRMVDAAEVAKTLGVARSWVYAHAGVLGATRLGSGSRGRLRFDLERARAAFVTVGETTRPTPRPRPRRRSSTAGSILKARPRGAP
jgi:hypothetical protein